MLAALVKKLFVPALIFVSLLAGPVGAASAADGDPPARAARVSEVFGDAWLFDTESKEWVRVTRNQTVAEGDRLRTDDRARISLSVGSTSLWLDERSDLEFSQLDEGRVLLLLAKGSLGLRLRSQEAVSEYKVLTREGRFFAEQQGLYRVEQIDRGSRAYAHQGRIRFEFEHGESSQPVWLQDGEQAEFWWAGGPRTERQRLENDGFGDWLLAQSQVEGDRFASGTSQRYVSPEMTGADELDRHGRWESSADYGNVWIPTTVALDWAPYRYGRWAWSLHWGWTWVDDAPWGFAPFHYGRWVSWGGRWCWAPGVYVTRPVYAPALVGWVGGVSVSIGGSYGGGHAQHPRYGWYPLAPREAYVPPYKHSPAHIRRLNPEAGPGAPARRPHGSNRDVVGAVSYLPGQGAPVRALPAAGPQAARPLPTAPARHELAAQLPTRSIIETQPRPAPADMSWRGENSGRREREQAREQARRYLPEANGTGPVAPVARTAPQAPQEVRSEGSAPGQRRERSDRSERAQRLEMPQQQSQQQPQQQPQQRNDAPAPSQPRQAADRMMEQMRERQGQGRPPGFERQAERQVDRQVDRQAERHRAPEPVAQVAAPAAVPAAPAPRPQVEAPRPAAPPPQPHDDGAGKRNKAEDSPKANGERRRNEAER